MDFQVKKRWTRTGNTAGHSLAALFPHDLQLYRIPPTDSVSLQEFEQLAAERLKVLRLIDTVTCLKGFKPFSEDWKSAIVEELNKEGLKNYAKSCSMAGYGGSEADIAFRRRDRLGHFILRLCYCRSEELRRWLVSKEVELFKIRFLSLTTEGVNKFLEAEHLKYKPMTREDKTNILDNLVESTMGSSAAIVDTLNFYKVRFNEVFDLIRFRKVFLKDGFAFIPSTDFVSVLATLFRSELNRALAIANRKLPELERDERLTGLLKGLHNSYTGRDYDTSSKNSLPIEQLDSLSRDAFPPCMRHLHEQLRSSHHLKHGGRIQYGLFLKAAGVTLEDSMRFWREEFTKIMDLDKFEKQYAYNVRYNYGKEGNRKNYSAYSCAKIIQGNVGPGDNHGCPFKHCDSAVLKTKLTSYGLNNLAINTLVDLSKKGHYQIACSRYFDVTHNVQMEIPINHPNQYLEECQNLLSGNIKPSNVRVKMENGTQSTQTQKEEEWDDELMNVEIPTNV